MLYLAIFLGLAAHALEIGTYTQNYLPPLPSTTMGVQESTRITIDANWRWVHEKNGYTNCFADKWVSSYCPDPITCSQNCALEGVDAATWAVPYGVSVSGSALTLKYVTKGQYGTNIGSRVYLMDSAGQNYKIFKLKNRQFSFDVDVSQLPCGLNGALYFVEMAADGGKNTLNKPGAPYGVGYGDAQCPSDIKFINGFANTNGTGICSHEMDIWEANSFATSFTPHTCSITGVTPCSTPQTCGSDSYRYSGFCDKDGGDYNPYRAGDTTFYGPGTEFKVNTKLPFTVVTQFITADGSDNGDLTAIRRYYVQNGKTIESHTMTDATIAAQKTRFSENNHFAKLGGMKGMGASMDRGMALVLSLWDDTSVNMLWLDSTYSAGTSAAGAVRGPCPTTNRSPDYLRATYPNSQVIYSKITLSAISDSPTPTPVPTTPTPVPTPVPTTPTPVPTPVPATPTPTPGTSCSAAYAQCGGQGWTGPTCCTLGYKCVSNGAYYSQCVPDTSVKIFQCTGCVQYPKNWTCASCV